MSPARLRNVWCAAWLPVGLCMLGAACAGCRNPGHLGGPQRYRQGVVYVLPGIEGPRPWNRDIMLGLDEGGVTSAIEIFDWTVGIPGSEMINLTDLERNRHQADRLARRILAYHQRHPGRPVHLVGHSGGGGIAVLALEALPDEQAVDMVILLAPALSPTHDLSRALRRVRFGVCNFYSEQDISFLKVGTTLFGPIDREFGFSAGAVGFEIPRGLSRDDRTLYADRLRQVSWDERLRRHGASGTHMGWTSRRFAREYLAPLIQRNESKRPLPVEWLE